LDKKGNKEEKEKKKKRNNRGLKHECSQLICFIVKLPQIPKLTDISPFSVAVQVSVEGGVKFKSTHKSGHPTALWTVRSWSA